jgi:phosphoribosylanthranilate isomerase
LSVRVKICGINDPAAFDAAVEARADWIGFVFFPPSPRSVTPTEAAALSARHPSGPDRVGLFVDPSVADVADALDALRLDALQLYAASGRIADVRMRFGVPVWRALGVATAAELPDRMDGLDRLMIEASPPLGGTRPGGNAARLDWRMLAGWAPPGPWTLGGGLTPDNVAEAIAVSGADAVDVSSGVERVLGVKDPALIRAFVAAARTPRS